MASQKKGTAPRFPTRDQVLEFIKDSDRPVGKREIARAFKLKSADKVRLRRLIAARVEGYQVQDVGS